MRNAEFGVRNGPHTRLLSKLLGAVLGTLVAAAALESVLAAQPPTTWLDQPSLPIWNAPGRALPSAPPAHDPIDPRFRERNRTPETPEDATLAAAGWDLIAPYEAGWGVKIITAAGDYDGMGRPEGFQTFVFVAGELAGTLSPDFMYARTDGALSSARLTGPNAISATFVRYTTADPLCCPSALSTVQYSIERGGLGPVVIPQSVFTRPTGPEGD